MSVCGSGDELRLELESKLDSYASNGSDKWHWVRLGPIHDAESTVDSA